MAIQEDLVKKLSEFGFTVNQAKIYLSIVESGLISVGKISQITQLHVQDIYKILPKLEKMGLITKTIDKPVLIKAIPVEKALNRLVTIEKEKAEKRIFYLEANLKEVTNAIKDQQCTELQDKESCFILLITSEQIKNRIDLTFGNASIECDLVINLGLIKPLMRKLRQNFQQLDRNKVKVRIIVENPSDDELVKKILKRAIPKQADITAKLILKNEAIPYYVIDHNEVWISMEKETESGLPCVLWTNSRNMVKFFQDSFDEAWNNTNAVSVYTSKEVKKELVSAQ